MKGMYYRRKVLMALLQVFGGSLEKLSLQKLLFLVTEEQAKRSYDFVPYKFGCFSFQANADLNALKKYNLVAETETRWECLDDANYYDALKQEERVILWKAKKQYRALSSDELIQLTYQKFPYYATRSVIAHDVLNAKELAQVEAQKHHGTETILFTIGYEGLSLEAYINQLIKHDVQVLCDVRKNSYSMKYGFSKSQLKTVCEGVGIEFLHIPELGIQSQKRKELNTQSDYDVLFEEYSQTVLKSERVKQDDLLQLLQTKKRIALTCFEKNTAQCHRTHLAESIAQLDGFNYEVRYI